MVFVTDCYPVGRAGFVTECCQGKERDILGLGLAYFSSTHVCHVLSVIPDSVVNLANGLLIDSFRARARARARAQRS